VQRRIMSTLEKLGVGPQARRKKVEEEVDRLLMRKKLKVPVDLREELVEAIGELERLMKQDNLRPSRANKDKILDDVIDDLLKDKKIREAIEKEQQTEIKKGTSSILNKNAG